MEHVEELVREPLALVGVHAVEPAGEGGVHAHAIRLEALGLHKPAGPDLPGHRVVLKRPVGRAPHDELLRAVVEEHADDVVGGDDVGERAAEHLAGARGRGPRPHAGAVVAPYTDHAGAKPFRHHRSSIRRENPALRVAADVEPAALRDGALGLPLKISRGRALCPRHAEAQHEVLFPADEAVVGAAERNVRASVGQVDG